MIMNIMNSLGAISGIILMATFLTMDGCSGPSAGDGVSTVQVTADTGLSVDKVQVDWAGEDRKFSRVFENGNFNGKIPGKAAEDNFEVYYEGKEVAGAGIRRSQPGNSHNFTIHLYHDKRGPSIIFKAQGPDSINQYFVKKYMHDLQGNINTYDFYDSRGLMTHQTYPTYDDRGELKSNNRFEFKYNAKRQLIEQVHFAWDAQGDLVHKMQNTFRYDEKGRKLEQTYATFNTDGTTKESNTNLYKYDELDREQERTYISFHPDKSVDQKYITVNEYDEAGRQVKEILLDRDRKKLNETLRFFNDKGYLQKEEILVFNPDGSLKERHGARFDEKGTVIEQF